MNDVIYTYSWQQAVEDGTLVKVFENRWPDLTHGKPILATRGVFTSYSLAGLQEIWNDFVRSDLKAVGDIFSTKMNNRKVWVMTEDLTITILFPEDY